MSTGADVFTRDMLCGVEWSSSGEYWKVWNTAAAALMDLVPASPGKATGTNLGLEEYLTY